ncbi:hypothetical protein DI09_24p90 [Mitosporidium daphniae]|uniref:Uncharacterized protein n=1 Tax=Mitosporidium daphniae TaxID=1485682 RepID=A0A098VS80_9MICR|nr:uncharacterized protein DI09_24p90 [Mitosporidium daphniae]KGG51888.1 hypothetical protein DI09_24p90 [Mitosporidium daphniae]|eukprot:XP_013238349.1 uncharacterized protein DI09_24p90 [Mitosporidium daphniae]
MQSAAAASRLGGKGTPRRKAKRSTTSTVADDRKIQATMKKLHAQPIPGIEVSYALELTELIPDILHQLGPDSISSLKRLAESFQQKGTLPSSFDEAISGAEL